MCLDWTHRDPRKVPVRFHPRVKLWYVTKGCKTLGVISCLPGL